MVEGERQSRPLGAWAEKKLRVSLPDFVTIVGMLGVILAVMAAFIPTTDEPNLSRSIFSVAEKERISDDLQTVRQELRELRQAQDALLRQATSEPAEIRTRLLVERLQAVEARQVRLERAILNDPAKALEVPLLRRDIESVREANAASLAAVQQSVEQVYDLSKWLFGALVVGIFSLAISNFLNRKGP